MVDVNSLISVQISLAAAAASGQNLTTLLCITSNTVIDLVQRYRTYSGSAAVGVDFGTSGPEYAAAVLAFSQSPQIPSFLVGRWAQDASQGQLIGAPLSAAQQAIALFTAVGADGGFGVALNGNAVEQITEIDLSAVVSLTGVAALITTALAGAAICTWNPVAGNFIFTSITTGGTSAVSFLTTPTGGGVTDLSVLLGCTATSSGAYASAGLAAETALTCATLFDSKFGSLWYALMMPSIVSDADHMAVFTYCQSSTRKHFYGATTQEAGVLVSTYTTDLASLTSAASFTKGMVQYSSTNACAVASPIARILTVNYAATNTDINLMWQTCPGLIAEPNLDDDAVLALQAKNCNVYAATDQNSTPIFLTGTTPSTNVFVDTVIGADNFGIAIQTSIFAAFQLAAISPGKIGFTDAGMHTLVVATIGTCDQFLTCGFLGASGTWPGAGFGSLQQGQVPPLENCYYVYAAPVATATPQVKSSRMAVPIQVAALLAGAINTAAVLVTIVP